MINNQYNEKQMATLMQKILTATPACFYPRSSAVKSGLVSHSAVPRTVRHFV